MRIIRFPNEHWLNNWAHCCISFSNNFKRFWFDCCHYQTNWKLDIYKTMHWSRSAILESLDIVFAVESLCQVHVCFQSNLFLFNRKMWKIINVTFTQGTQHCSVFENEYVWSCHSFDAKTYNSQKTE